MCGRYTLTRRQSEIMERFAVAEMSCSAEPRFNIAPSQVVPVIYESGGKRVMDACKWGLVPFWARDAAPTKALINARCETLAQKPSFKQCLARRRCLIPADGFFEWKRSGKTRQPIYFQLKGHELFAFAGLFEKWQDEEGKPLMTCAIITCPANSCVAPVHDRMPAIVPPSLESLWLDASVQKIDDLQGIFEPYPSSEMLLYPVSPAVNSPSTDCKELLEPASEWTQ